MLIVQGRVRLVSKLALNRGSFNITLADHQLDDLKKMKDPIALIDSVWINGDLVPFDDVFTKAEVNKRGSVKIYFEPNSVKGRHKIEFNDFAIVDRHVSDDEVKDLKKELSILEAIT